MGGLSPPTARKLDGAASTGAPAEGGSAAMCMITFCEAWMSSRLTRYVRHSPCCAGCPTACAVANAPAALSRREYRPLPERCESPAEQLRPARKRAATLL